MRASESPYLAIETPPISIGLSDIEAQARRKTFGPNRLPQARGTPVWRVALAQFTHFFALLLWIAALFAFVAGMPQLALAIVAVILLNGIFAFVQEYRAERAAEKLRTLLPQRVTVRRDGQERLIDAAELVPGDVVILRAGDRVPADIELVEVDDFGLDVSTFTGESVPVTPMTGESIFAGSFVVRGEAVGIVRATGAATRLASIARLTQTPQREPTPLTKELTRLVKTISIIALSIGGLFFVVAILAGLPLVDAFIFTLGVTVALVPEGLLPTLTLSLAVAAQRMAQRQALVRHLEAVETLGLTTVICTDKTGTLTRNELVAVRVWTPRGEATVAGDGYDPNGTVISSEEAQPAIRHLVEAAVFCSEGRAVLHDGRWIPEGDPLDVAIWVLARRLGLEPDQLRDQNPVALRFPFDAELRRSSVVLDDRVIVKGAPEAVLPLCLRAQDIQPVITAFASQGLRVIAVAQRERQPSDYSLQRKDLERDLSLLGLIGFLDPPRPEAADAIERCRQAGIRVIMVTGDHPLTATAIARQVRLVREQPFVVTGAELPADEAVLGALIDRDETVIARVTPEDKLRIARALRHRGHVVAMTGDGVNDAPALHEADVGVAMGKSGTDVAREAADLVLLDDNFATIVAAIEQGRATYSNIRRFLTYHLTDNVAELAPFVVWALSGGRLPLALGVLQILLLDLGTDALPALALGLEAPSTDILRQPPPRQHLVDRWVLSRALLILGPVEAFVEMLSFFLVLHALGWHPGSAPTTGALLAASGTAFAAVVFGQIGNALAQRSDSLPGWRVGLRGNRALGFALLASLLMLVASFAVIPLARVLGQAPPPPLGWALAMTAAPAVLLIDALVKRFGRPGGRPRHGFAQP